jgi:hypothetical protein
VTALREIASGLRETQIINTRIQTARQDFEKAKMMNNKELEEQISTNNKKWKKKREEYKQLLQITNPCLNPSFNPTHPMTNIPMYPNFNQNPTRNDVIKLDRTGKYVLKLPPTSRNKDNKLDQIESNTREPQKKFKKTTEAIIQWNINVLRAHFEDPKLLIDESDPTVMCLQEIHIKKNNQSP